MPLEKDKLGVILLGASQFPKSKAFSGSIAFFNAKQRIKGYFTQKFQLTEPNEILDLFDKDYSPDEIDVEISNFIQIKGDLIRDLIIYYVGHGGYDNTNGGFLLAIKKSRDSNLGVSSITGISLGKTLSKFASSLRLFLILDCCFASEIFSKFQTPYIDVVTKQISSSFPENGIALLCSSSKDEPSIIVKDGSITMFTDAFDNALKIGNSQIKREYLTLRELGNLTFSYIKSINPGEAVRPEIHSPIMPNGDIADLPQFPNSAYMSGVEIAYNIELRKNEIEENIVYNNLLNVGSLFLSFVKDFDSLKNYTKVKIKIASRCNALEDMKPNKEHHLLYKEYLENRESIYNEVLDIINEIFPS